MTNTQVVALGVRLFCIWLAVYILRYAPAMWSLNTDVMPDRGAAAAVVVVTIVLVAMVVLLWRFPLAVARKLLPQEVLDHPTALPVDALQSAGFCLLGLWLLTDAIPAIFYLAVLIYHATRPNAMLHLDAENYASIAQSIVELLLGLWLLLGSKGLLRVVRWARTAGTGASADGALESEAAPTAAQRER